MVDPSLNPTACWEFEGDILVLHHPTTISTKYQAMGENFKLSSWILWLLYCLLFLAVHCGSTRQTASIISMDKDHLRTGDKATCHFRFIKNPEFIHPSTRMVFREGRTKAVGSITKIIPHVPGTPLQTQKYKSSGVHHHHPPHHPPGHGKGKGRRGKGKYRTAATAGGSSISVSTQSTSSESTSSK